MYYFFFFFLFHFLPRYNTKKLVYSFYYVFIAKLHTLNPQPNPHHIIMGGGSTEVPFELELIGDSFY